jgi:hypothetical protein
MMKRASGCYEDMGEAIIGAPSFIGGNLFIPLLRLPTND